MTDAPRYPMACVLAAWAMTPLDVSDAELKGILASASDVPADRLDFCFSEMKQALPHVRQILPMLAVLHDGPLTARDIEGMIGESSWIDDTKGTARIGVTVVDKEGDVVASAAGKFKLD